VTGTPNARRRPRVAVVGSGYVGTVVAACLSAVLEYDVVDLEVDQAKLEMLRRGEVPFFETALQELVRRGAASGRLQFTDDVRQALDASDIVILCVGTPPTQGGRPDMTAAEAAARSIASALDRHHVIVTKSTVPIGCGHWLESVMTDALPPERRREHLFSVVSNPEFLREGSAIQDFLYPDRVVIGSDDDAALEDVAHLYRPIVDQSFAGGNGKRPRLLLTSLTTAETIKYAANAFLATKISFINEVAHVCEMVGADVTEVSEAMGLDHRIGPGALQAGVGWGGSCFGKDLHALISIAEEYGASTALLDAVVNVNARQRLVVVDKLRRHLKTLQGRRVGILGLAFKPGTDDTRDSPALDIAERLLQQRVFVTAHDPVVSLLPELPGVRLVEDPYAVADDADAIVLATEWPAYLELDPRILAERMHGDLIIDGRNILDRGSYRAAGLLYEGFGRPAATGTGIHDHRRMVFDAMPPAIDRPLTSAIA
jgi:UDPglucose 6-dehydrogenase